MVSDKSKRSGDRNDERGTQEKVYNLTTFDRFHHICCIVLTNTGNRFRRVPF